jgi:peptide deformylase
MTTTKSQYKLITVPNPLLREKSKRVGLISDHIREVIGAMEESMLEWENSRKHEVGVALAASQIGQLLRIVIVRHDFDNKEDRTFSVFIDPVITKYEGIMVEDFEGCLSVKDIYGKVPRHSKVRVKARDLDGREFRVTAEGFLARVFQHEVDHTNGKLFIDQIKDVPEAFYRLMPDGNLEKVDYEKEIKDNNIFWE